jgi:hypothetical protein
VSTDLTTKIQLGLEEFATVREQISPLIAKSSNSEVGDIETAAAPTNTRPAVITSGLVEILSEFLAFRHLFRGASIAVMRWDKLSPLLAKVDQTYLQTRQELETFRTFLRSRSDPAQ